MSLLVTSSSPKVQSHPSVVTGQAASDTLKAHIAGSDPALIGRLGAVELEAVIHNFAVQRDKHPLRRGILRLAGRPPESWSIRSAEGLTNNAGFFPPQPDLIERFCDLMLSAMKEVDVLGSWLPAEETVASYLTRAVRVELRDLEPYYHPDPWTEALAGKRVLVVHPFQHSIESQFARRQLLFQDPRILPTFELTVIRAVQSIAGTRTEYPTWFDAYEHMRLQMSDVDFDVALVGCGAYGLPLAAHAKRLGRKGIHLGGALQILFGIKGRRWDGHEFISHLYNEHWVRPNASERPPNHAQVEDGCYW